MGEVLLKDHIVTIDYTDWRGERSLRKIVPGVITFQASQYYDAGKQWFLAAWDTEMGAAEFFAMTDIHSWKVEG